MRRVLACILCLLSLTGCAAAPEDARLVLRNATGHSVESVYADGGEDLLTAGPLADGAAVRVEYTPVPDALCALTLTFENGDVAVLPPAVFAPGEEVTLRLSLPS